jgi:hypothetical protein
VAVAEAESVAVAVAVSVAAAQPGAVAAAQPVAEAVAQPAAVAVAQPAAVVLARVAGVLVARAFPTIPPNLGAADAASRMRVRHLDVMQARSWLFSSLPADCPDAGALPRNVSTKKLRIKGPCV